MSSEVQPKCTSSSTRGRGAARRELLAHEVLHGLHVVVDAALDGLDRRRRVVAGFERQARGELFRPVRRSGCAEQLRHGFGQRQQPGGFDAHALADQAAFRQHGAQWVGSLCDSGRRREKARKVLRDP